MYRLVLATQSCTLASTTGYRLYRLVLAKQSSSTTVTRVYGGYWLHSLVHLLQQLVTECTAGTGYTASYTCFNNWLHSVPAGTGYTALYTCFNNWLHSVRLVLATQPRTLASTTGCRVYQLVLAKQSSSTTVTRVYGGYWLHSLVHLLQQLVTECTGSY